MVETVPKHIESIMLQLLLVILSICFFFSKGNFAKKGVIEVIDMLCNMKVKCDFLRQKKNFFSRYKNIFSE